MTPEGLVGMAASCVLRDAGRRAVVCLLADWLVGWLVYWWKPVAGRPGWARRFSPFAQVTALTPLSGKQGGTHQGPGPGSEQAESNPGSTPGGPTLGQPLAGLCSGSWGSCEVKCIWQVSIPELYYVVHTEGLSRAAAGSTQQAPEQGL